MNILSKCAVALAFMIAPIGAANAIILTTIHSGTVTSGIDVDGVFGTAGRDMAGLGYSITYVYDTDASGSIEYNRYLEGYYDFDQWLIGAGGASATFTIDGITRELSGTGDVNRQILDPAVYGALALTQDRLLFAEGHLVSYVGSSETMFYSSKDLTIPFALVLDAEMLAHDDTNSDFLFNNTLLFLRETAMSADSGSPIPEPASWAMMLCGFALLGTALRRQAAVRLRSR